MKFTDKSIKALLAKDNAYVMTEESDTRGGGRFQVKVYKSGAKAFQVQYFYNGKKRRLEIGKYPTWSLADARRKFYELSDLVATGNDIGAQKKEKIAAKKRMNEQVALHVLISDFIGYAERVYAEKTVITLKRCFNHDLLPFIGDGVSIEEFIASDAVRGVIYAVYNRGAVHKANIFRSNLLSMFKFAINYDNSPSRFGKPPRYDVKYNPVRDIVIDAPKNANQRWLSEDEVRKIWWADDLTVNAKLYFRLALALGGQRIDEVFKSYAHEYDFVDNILTIPSSRVKVRRRGDHIVPLSDLAIEILKEIFIHRGSTGALFPLRGDLSQPTHHRVTNEVYSKWCKRHDIERFSAKTFRSTAKTLMTKAGVPIYIRDMLQQHNKRDVATVHYDRYDYLKEKRQGIEVWTAYLMRVVGGASA
ncbi:tyrosine-type recombinase/integrase [Psychrobium sp. nBUS_13]|uniref:tyrosine-type recombinase/integrase n=1 Tax=Psychrobium sp. nBUS_13 TaxID=3395319 RepID=UPI003EBDEED6